MPMIRITNLSDGALVYEGEGELILGPRPGRPTNLLADGVVIRQEQRQEDGERRARQIDISELVRGVPAEYRINYAPLPLPTVGWDPSGDAWEFNIPVPEPVQLYELRAEFQPGMAQWLRDALERSFETPEERDARERARSEALRSAWLSPGGPITFDDIRDGLRRRRRPEPTMGDLWRAERDAETEDRWGEAYRAYLAQTVCAPADVAEMFGLDPELTESGRRAGEGLHSLTEAFQRNEEAITSTRAEFPHDPYDYGRIYPGDQGTSHWTPPADPNEKIRSCP